MVAIEGLLEPEAGQIVLAGLEPLARPTNAEDTRTGGQRRADALTELARRALEAGRLPKTGGVRPQLLVTVDDRAEGDHGGAGPGAELAVDGQAPLVGGQAPLDGGDGVLRSPGSTGSIPHSPAAGGEPDRDPGRRPRRRRRRPFPDPAHPGEQRDREGGQQQPAQREGQPAGPGAQMAGRGRWHAARTPSGKEPAGTGARAAKDEHRTEGSRWRQPSSDRPAAPPA
jgi:Domain of unknown function (DUF222)